MRKPEEGEDFPNWVPSDKVGPALQRAIDSILRKARIGESIPEIPPRSGE